MKRNGPRVRMRQRMNANLKEQLGEMGIRGCELQLTGCIQTMFLSFAHARKSRFLSTEKDWLTACLACQSCHAKIEAMSHAEMERHVLEAIGRREEITCFTE